MMARLKYFFLSILQYALKITDSCHPVLSTRTSAADPPWRRLTIPAGGNSFDRRSNSNFSRVAGIAADLNAQIGFDADKHNHIKTAAESMHTFTEPVHAPLVSTQARPVCSD